MLKKILVSNDDGIFAEGIDSLVQELKKDFKVYVVAPNAENSGKSHSITMNQPLYLKKHRIWDNVESYSISGTPADCVKIALTNLIKEKIDYVISGINLGANLGTDVIYSGTVAAAREGLLNEISSIAISSFNPLSSKSYLNNCAKQFSNMLKQKFFCEKTLWNVNFPKETSYEILKTEYTVLGKVVYENIFEENKDKDGNTYYNMKGKVKPLKQKENTDVEAINKGKISITPLLMDFTDFNKMNLL